MMSLLYHYKQEKNRVGVECMIKEVHGIACVKTRPLSPGWVTKRGKALSWQLIYNVTQSGVKQSTTPQLQRAGRLSPGLVH